MWRNTSIYTRHPFIPPTPKVCPTPKGCVSLLSGIPGPNRKEINIFSGREVLALMCKGYSILSILGKYEHEPEDKVGQFTAALNFNRAFMAFILMGQVVCGDAVLQILEDRRICCDTILHHAQKAAANKEVRQLLVWTTEKTFQVAEEFDVMSKVWSLDYLMFYFNPRMVGKHSLTRIMELGLQVLEGPYRVEGEARIYRKHEMNGKNCWLGKEEFQEETKFYIPRKDIKANFSFTELVEETHKSTRRTVSPADRSAVTALAEIRFVVDSEPDSKTNLGHISGNDGIHTKDLEALKNEESPSLAQFKLEDRHAISLKLDGSTGDSETEDWEPGMSYPLFRAPPLKLTCRTIYQPPSYMYVEKVDKVSFEAMEILRQPGSPWNDGLEINLRELNKEGFPLGGEYASKSVKWAREEFHAAASWKPEDTSTVFSMPRTIVTYLRAKRSGHSLTSCLYQQALSMFHPHETYMDGQPLIKFLTGVYPIDHRDESFFHDVKQAYGV